MSNNEAVRKAMLAISQDMSESARRFQEIQGPKIAAAMAVIVAAASKVGTSSAQRKEAAPVPED